MKWKRFLGTLCCHKAVFLRGVTSTLNSFYATKRQPLLFFNEKCGLKDPGTRGKSIGMGQGFTIFLGIAEVGGGLGVTFGVLTQLAAIGLILIMLGAIQKKIFVWHTGFWGEKASGWHYDLLFVVMSLVILFTDGGRWVLWK